MVPCHAASCRKRSKGEGRIEKREKTLFSFLLSPFCLFSDDAGESEWRSEVATWREKDRTRNYRTPADIDIPAYRETLRTRACPNQALQNRPARARNPHRGCGSETG